MAGSAFDAWAYTPPPSLWELVEQNVSPEEQEEIRSMLGTSLIETTQDLHNEVNMLLEIWRDYQEETEVKSQNTRILAEPPHVRERLIQEISFLAESIREKSARKGMDAVAVLSRHNSHVLDYAEETKRCGSSLGSARPLSARSSDGRQTPLSPADQACSRSALSSNISEEVSSASDKLNYMHFEEVCNRLRETLTKEMEQLEQDVAFLQSCLDDAADIRSYGGTPALSREPSITELREERTKLEKDLLSAERLPSTPTVNRPPFLPKATGIRVLDQIGPVKPKLRSAQSTSNTGPSRPAPLKASHSVATQGLCLSTQSASHEGSSSNPSESSSHTKPYSSPRSGDSSQVSGAEIEINIPVRGQNMASGKEESHYRSWTGKSHDKVGDSPKRAPSAARFKVVPVGNVLGPRVDSAGSTRSLMPTPPPEENPNVSRPSSAQRFRRIVMQYRDSS